MCRQAENSLDARALGDFPRGSGGALQPSIEVLNLYGVLDRDIHYRNLNTVHSIGEPHYPIVAANGHQAESHGLVKSFGSDLDSVFDAFQIFEGDAAGTGRHNGRNLSYSLFVRHVKICVG